MSRVRSTGVVLAMVVTLLTSAGCGVLPGLGSESLITLAKVDGWREGFELPPDTFAVLEVAYDSETAQQMSDENLTSDLPERSGDPRDPGRFGDLDDVDFDQQAVALWSGGQSGSCPGWVADVEMVDSVVVVTENAEEPQGCSDDYNPFRVLVVVDRSDLPEPGELATTKARSSNAHIGKQVLLAAYPLH